MSLETDHPDYPNLPGEKPCDTARIADALERIAACMEKAEERNDALTFRSMAMMEKGMAMAERTEAELDNL